MGNVVLALHGKPGMEKLCVVKRLIPETVKDPDSLARFRREANLARRLAHGTIASTLEVGELEGEPFIVQEYLEGRTITQALSAAQSAGVKMSIELAVHIVREVARALAYAHREAGGGVIHRDVSPENIMLTFIGEVRLIDFGVARSTGDPALTQTGLVVGRETFMAPEVLRGAVADRRSDVYSLGVVLWELLADASLALRLLNQDVVAPSAVARRAGISAALDAVALKAIAADPAQRFQSAEELHKALAPFLPRDFMGEDAVSSFMGHCYDVETERRRLAESVKGARKLLEPSSTPAPSVTAAADQTTPRRRRKVGRLAAAGAVLLALGAVSYSRRLARRPSAVPQAVVAPAVASPVIVPVMPPPSAMPAPETLPTHGPEVEPIPSPPSRVTPSRKAAPAPRPPAQNVDEMLAEAGGNLLEGESAAAERQARDLLKLGSPVQKSRAHEIIGQSYEIRHRYKEAEAEFAEAVRLDPKNAPAKVELERAHGKVAEEGGGRE